MLITFISGYIGAIALRIKKPFMDYMPSLFLLNILFFILFSHINYPIYTLVSSRAPKHNGFLQSTNYSCTSASIATIALSYNKKIDEKYIAYLSGLSKFGATSAQIRYTLNKIHLNYITLINVAFKLNKIEPPAIIYIDHPSLGVESHAVAYLDYNNTGYKIWDPLQGIRVITDNNMNHIWHGNGIKIYSPTKAP
jgi:ABC-type bacteriocin/lantibiotic exporter with double-glycine peptidase domain